jgi:hypothetical protein
VTLSLAWIRTVGDIAELVVATDSRLRSPFTWDCCPKILPLARGDAAICFAGETYLAYPIMLQLQSALRMHPKSLTRSTDIYDLKGYFLEVINGMRDWMFELPSDPDAAGQESTFFLLAGFSWRRSEFAIWTLSYAKDIKAFTFHPARWWRGEDQAKKLTLVGDGVDDAKERLVRILRSKNKLTSGGFDLEPLAVLRDIIRDGEHPSIGGAPQLVKIYRHMNVTPFGMFWPDRKSEQKTLLGRPMLAYETSAFPMLDPDTLEVV